MAHDALNTARRFRSLSRAIVLGRALPVADTRVSRLLGLALLRRSRAGPGLLIPGCRSVHTFGMLFAIDVVFLDSAGEQIEVRPGVRPGRVVTRAGASAIAEFAAGTGASFLAPSASRE